MDDRLAVALLRARVLDHYNSVRARRNRGAGHDLHALAGCERASKALSGSNFAYKLEFAAARAEIFRAHRETISRGAIKRRVIAIGAHRLSEHAAERFAERQRFAFHGRFQPAHDLDYFSPGVFKR